MLTLPETLEEATTQAIDATFAAIDAGLSRIQVNMRFSELKPLPVAKEFAHQFNARYGDAWQALFADAGAAALARRDWQDLEVSLRGINEGRAAIRPEDQAFLLVAPSFVEVDRVEKVLQLSGDRPFVMLNPQLESGDIGLGLAARRVRERFLNSFEVAYYIQPLEQGALWRCYPQPWQVWQQNEDGMKMVFTGEQRPSSDDLNSIFMKATGKGSSLFSRMQQFLNTITK